ncbi:MAG: hypothetical protein PHF89_03435 [Eubacteriales bacterium]|jgi:Flp pilus assembly protein TadB|nr:hypothetical protein [Eubacteriales bacterium]
MVTKNIKECSNEEIAEMIDKVRTKEISYTLNDLKKLLAEVTNRKMEQSYITILANLVQSELTGESYVPSPTADINKISRPKKAEKEKKQPEKVEKSAPLVMETAENEEKYPVLEFLAGLYRIIAWFFLVVAAASASVAGYIYFKNNMLYLISSVFAGVFVGLVALICLYARAERISLQLEIEKHLSRISKSIK